VPIAFVGSATVLPDVSVVRRQPTRARPTSTVTAAAMAAEPMATLAITAQRVPMAIVMLPSAVEPVSMKSSSMSGTLGWVTPPLTLP